MTWHLEHPHDFFIAGIVVGIYVVVVVASLIGMIKVALDFQREMREKRSRGRRE